MNATTPSATTGDSPAIVDADAGAIGAAPFVFARGWLLHGQHRESGAVAIGP